MESDSIFFRFCYKHLIQLLTDRKNPRLRRNVNLPVIGQPHLIPAGEYPEARQDCLVLVDYETGEPYALAAFAVGGENRVHVAGENEFCGVEFYFWMVGENKYIFFIIIHIHLHIAFEKKAYRQDVVVAHDNDHFYVMVFGTPGAKGFPFGIVFVVKKVAEEDDAGRAGLPDELIEPLKVVGCSILRDGNPFFSEMRDFP